MVNKMTYTVPDQDLKIEISRIPAIPKSWLVISKVHLL